MATIKDFILKSGLQVNTTATIGGVDVLANDYATYTTLSSELAANDYATLLAARSNDYTTYVTLQSEYRANDYNTYTTLSGMIDSVQDNVGGGATGFNANDYNTYTTLQGEYRANDYATYTTLTSEYSANDYATLLAARANDGATLSSARANDYSTYTTLVGEYEANDYNTYSTLTSDFSANDYTTYSTLQSELAANDYATLLAARSNDYSTYTTLTSDFSANDYATYSTLQSELSANDYNTLLSARANDGVTLNSARANDYTTYTTLQSEYRANDYNSYTSLTSEYSANDGVTLNSARANDYNTYTTLQGELSANDYNTYTTLSSDFAANDYATLLSARANDGVTLNSARANDYNTYTTLVNEYSANDHSTYTTLQSEYRANDYSTWSGLNSAVNIKANSAVTLTAGDGLSGGGDLSASRSFAVDATVVRTSGDQTIAGIKTFSDNVVVEGDLTVEGNTTTIGTTSLLVEDKFIELASNTVGVPAGDVGIYLNRGSFGNSAIYYDQAAGEFALAETADPATNTSVSPTSYANLRINALSVSSTDLVTNLNADLLDSQSGAYYLDFANATNTDFIDLAYVTANGATTTDTINAGGLVVDTNTLYVDSANDRVGINTLAPAADLQVSNAALSTSIVVSSAITSYTLDSLPIADFRTAKYLIQAHDTVTNDYQTSELLLIHDDTTAYLTEYAIIYTAGSLGSFDASLVSGDIRLNATPTSTNSTTFKVYRQALTI